MRNISVNLFLICLFLIGTANLYSATFSGGDGTTIPYQITYLADIEELADSVNLGVTSFLGKSFELTADIIDSVRTMIGNDVYYFQGLLNGNNKRITLALDYIDSLNRYVGLFSQLGDGGSIYNLIVDGYVIGGASSRCVGGFAGFSTGIAFWYCTNLSDITGESPTSSVGGIVGAAVGIGNGDGEFVYCINNGTITGGRYVAGIIGCATDISGEDATMQHCKNAGTIRGIGSNYSSYIAGIIAFCGGDNVFNIALNLVNIGNIEGNNYDYASGIIAYFERGRLSVGSNSGIVEGARITHSGIVAYVGIDVRVSGFINTNWIEPIGNAGAIVGINDGQVDSCYFDEQMCIVDDIGINRGISISVSGFPTVGMIGISLRSLLPSIGSYSWPPSSFMHPQLYPVLDNSGHPIYLLAAAPIYLPTGQKVDNVTNDFWVSNENMYPPPFFTPPAITLLSPYYFQWGWYNPYKQFSLYNYVEILTPNIATIRSRLGWDSLAVRLTNHPTDTNYRIYEKVVPIYVR